MGVVRRTHDDHPALITSVPQSSGDEYDKRRKKYAIMMGTRVICVILAAVSYQISVALAVAFAIAGVILPWCAVLIANDRPVKRRATELGYVQVPIERALPPSPNDDRVVDG